MIYYFKVNLKLVSTSQTKIDSGEVFYSLSFRFPFTGLG